MRSFVEDLTELPQKLQITGVEASVVFNGAQSKIVPFIVHMNLDKRWADSIHQARSDADGCLLHLNIKYIFEAIDRLA